jgi:hypothetical protein
VDQYFRPGCGSLQRSPGHIYLIRGIFRICHVRGHALYFLHKIVPVPSYKSQRWVRVIFCVLINSATTIATQDGAQNKKLGVCLVEAGGVRVGASVSTPVSQNEDTDCGSNVAKNETIPSLCSSQVKRKEEVSDRTDSSPQESADHANIGDRIVQRGRIRLFLVLLLCFLAQRKTPTWSMGLQFQMLWCGRYATVARRRINAKSTGGTTAGGVTTIVCMPRQIYNNNSLMIFTPKRFLLHCPFDIGQ